MPNRRFTPTIGTDVANITPALKYSYAKVKEWVEDGGFSEALADVSLLAAKDLIDNLKIAKDKRARVESAAMAHARASGQSRFSVQNRN